MLKRRDVRTLALSLPESIEADHHGFPSFRVAKKIFATLPDDEHVHVMLGPDETDAAVATDPKAFEELWWGKKLSGVRVNLAAADRTRFVALLVEAWKRKAPRKLAAAFDRASIE